MFDMFMSSVTLFLRGKLFRDTRAVARQAAMGITVAALLCLVLSLAGTPLWLAVGVASVAAGALQPWLFRNLKYQ